MNILKNIYYLLNKYYIYYYYIPYIYISIIVNFEKL